jgi:hypothetical protein
MIRLAITPAAYEAIAENLKLRYLGGPSAMREAFWRGSSPEDRRSPMG